MENTSFEICSNINLTYQIAKQRMSGINQTLVRAKCHTSSCKFLAEIPKDLSK